MVVFKQPSRTNWYLLLLCPVLCILLLSLNFYYLHNSLVPDPPAPIKPSSQKDFPIFLSFDKKDKPQMDAALLKDIDMLLNPPLPLRSKTKHLVQTPETPVSNPN